MSPDSLSQVWGPVQLGMDPFAYLRDLFGRIAACFGGSVDHLIYRAQANPTMGSPDAYDWAAL